jgi:hypothetical protein
LPASSDPTPASGDPTPDGPHRPAADRRRRLFGALAAASVLAFVAVLVIALAGHGGSSGGAGATSGSAKPATLPAPRVGPEAMFTPSVEIEQHPARVLNTLRALGVDTVNVYLPWSSVAPDPNSRARPVFDATDPAAYPASAWAVWDTIVRDTRARGMRIALALVGPPPDWASGKGAPHPSTQPEWRPSAPDFGEFVRAVGVRYSGHYTPPGASSPLPRVSFWGIWNEPNIGALGLAPEVMPHTQNEVSGILYRGMLDAAWSALHATGHGSDTILIGELAPAGATFAGAPGLFGAMAPLRFLRALYCVDSSYRPLRGSAAKLRGCPATAAASATFAARNPGLFHASGFADHPYSQGLPPDAVTPDEPDYTELGAIDHLERVLDTIQRAYGSRTRYQIWSTEFGYQTTPPDPEAGTVTPAQAAYYLNWAEYLTWLDPRQRSYDQYLLIDPPGGNFATGLLTRSGTPKPGFYAYRMPLYLPVTRAARGARLLVWGCVRPAPDARRATGRPQIAQLQFRATGGVGFRTIVKIPITDRYGYFDLLQRFDSAGELRVAWRSPDGTEAFSRTVVVSLR